MNSLLKKTIDGTRLTPAEALDILKNAPWTEVVQAGDAMRHRINPGNKVGYTAFRIINYTNVCEITCSFCSFCRPAHSPEAYVLNLDEIRQKTIEAKARGADQIFLQGGVNQALPLSSVPGAGAEILSDRMRQILSPKKLPAQVWCDTLAACHKKGLPGSANIVFGSVETPEEIIEHLDYVRKTQDIANGFKSFVVWTFQPQTDKFPIRHVRGDEYLKLLALSRLYLDNIPHIEVSLLGMGLSLGELGLHSGADDINSIVIEENVLQNHGLTTIEQAEEFIKNAGFTPYRRTLNFD